MRAGYEKQLKRGVLEMIILSIVCTDPSYGYEIKKKLNSNSTGFFETKEGTIYPILYRLEDEGLIRSRWGGTRHFEVVENRTEKPKKMYSATAKGYVALVEMQGIWKAFQTATNEFVASGK